MWFFPEDYHNKTRPKKYIPIVLPPCSTYIHNHMKKIRPTILATALAISSVSILIGCSEAIDEDPTAREKEAENKVEPKKGPDGKKLPENPADGGVKIKISRAGCAARSGKPTAIARPPSSLRRTQAWHAPGAGRLVREWFSRDTKNKHAFFSIRSWFVHLPVRESRYFSAK